MPAEKTEITLDPRHHYRIAEQLKAWQFEIDTSNYDFQILSVSLSKLECDQDPSIPGLAFQLTLFYTSRDSLFRKKVTVKLVVQKPGEYTVIQGNMCANRAVSLALDEAMKNWFGEE